MSDPRMHKCVACGAAVEVFGAARPYERGSTVCDECARDPDRVNRIMREDDEMDARYAADMARLDREDSR